MHPFSILLSIIHAVKISFTNLNSGLNFSTTINGSIFPKMISIHSNDNIMASLVWYHSFGALTKTLSSPTAPPPPPLPSFSQQKTLTQGYLYINSRSRKIFQFKDNEGLWIEWLESHVRECLQISILILSLWKSVCWLGTQYSTNIQVFHKGFLK